MRRILAATDGSANGDRAVGKDDLGPALKAAQIAVGAIAPCVNSSAPRRK
jgi:hypothetical protein